MHMFDRESQTASEPKSYGPYAPTIMLMQEQG